MDNKIKVGELANFLRQKREERGLSVRALAEMAGISYSNYSTLENNSERPTASLVTLYRLHKPLNVYLSELLYYAGYIPPRASDIQGSKLIKNAFNVYSKLIIQSFKSQNEAQKTFGALVSYLVTKRNMTFDEMNNILKSQYNVDNVGLELKISDKTLINFIKELVIAEVLIHIANILNTDVDEFLFLAGRIPDSLLHHPELPEFTQKMELFSAALQKAINITNGDQEELWPAYFMQKAELEFNYIKAPQYLKAETTPMVKEIKISWSPDGDLQITVPSSLSKDKISKLLNFIVDLNN